jgi:hypothetical protein
VADGRGSATSSPGSTLRYQRDRGVFLLADAGDEIAIRHNGSDAWVARLEDIASLRASTLKRALRRAADEISGYDGFEVVEGLEPGFEDGVQGDVRFAIARDQLVIVVDVQLDGEVEAMDDVVARLRRLARPLLDRDRADLVAATPLAEFPGGYLCAVRIIPSIRGRGVGDLYRLGDDVRRLFDAASGGRLTLWSTHQLVLAGRGDLLVGQREGPWLDAKGQDYDLDSDSGKISLAQDVARFANGEEGGLVVVGLRTKKVAGGEVIDAVSPVPVPKSGTKRHRQAIDNRVFPPPDGLTVHQVDMGGGAMIVVHIPPQAEELKPFLVHGAIVAGKVEGAFISIVRRRGEDSIPITAPAIHASLAAGRALLRRGELPS